MDTFDSFDKGRLALPEKSVDFARLAWNKHPAFAGVELKDIVMAAETGGKLSCHLVRIAPNCSIGAHVHEAQLELHEVVAGKGTCVNGGAELPYQAGTVSIMPPGVPHEVRAGEEGLCLFAKFVSVR